MRRMVTLGLCYGLAIAGLLCAEDMYVAVDTADLLKEADTYSDPAGTLHAGERVQTDKEMGDFVHVTAGDKSGWLAKSDLYTDAQYTKTMGKAGKDSEKKGQEGAYAKGFDPEVEKRAKQDDATMAKYIDEEVRPLIWATRGSRQLEDAEEALEEYVMQHPQSMKDGGEGHDQYAAKMKEIEALRLANEPFRSDWQAQVRAFQQAGGLGKPSARRDK